MNFEWPFVEMVIGMVCLVFLRMLVNLLFFCTSAQQNIVGEALLHAVMGDPSPW